MGVVDVADPGTLTDQVLLGMVPKAGRLVPWNGEEHIVYLRDSAPHLAEGSGPPVQLRQCLERQRGVGYYGPVLVLLEVQSATEDFSYRPVLSYVRAILRERKGLTLWCQGTGRMSRNSVDHIILDREAKKSGARILYAMHEQLDNLDGLMKELVLYVLGVVDQLEAVNIRMKMYEGRKFKWAQGRLMGNAPAPYGHIYADAEGHGRVKNGRLVPNPSTYPRVVGWYHRIYSAVKGPGERLDVSLRQIARELTEEGVTPPFAGKRKHPGRWHSASIHNILLNEANIGIVRAGKTITERREVLNKKTGRYEMKNLKTSVPAEEQSILQGAGECLPGLAPEVFYAVAQMIRDPRRAPKKLENPDDFPLRGRVVCECGYFMSPYNKTRRKEDPNPVPVYRCIASANGGACRHVIIGRKLHDPAWQAVRRFLDDEASIEKLILNRKKADLSPLAAETQIVEEMISQKTGDIDDWADMAKGMKGRSREKVLADLAQVEDQLEGLRQRLLRLQGRKQAMTVIDERVIGLREKLRTMREALQLVERGDDQGRISKVEFQRLQRTAYKALDIQVKVQHYPEGTSMSEKQRDPARFTISSILGPMLTRFDRASAATEGRMKESGPRTP